MKLTYLDALYGGKGSLFAMHSIGIVLNLVILAASHPTKEYHKGLTYHAHEVRQDTVDCIYVPSIADSWNISAGIGKGVDEYTTWSGVLNSTWPSVDQWISFDAMFVINMRKMRNACTSLNLAVQENSQDEIWDMYEAISAAANASRIDQRFILAIILQETNGCIRTPVRTAPRDSIPTNRSGVMQAWIDNTHACGKRQFNPSETTCTGLTICSRSAIFTMVFSGVQGWHSLVEHANVAYWSYVGTPGIGPEFDAERYYIAAKGYADGFYDGDQVSDGPYPCYVSDVVNRLTGWVDAESTCRLTSHEPRPSINPPRNGSQSAWII